MRFYKRRVRSLFARHLFYLKSKAFTANEHKYTRMYLVCTPTAYSKNKTFGLICVFCVDVNGVTNSAGAWMRMSCHLQ